MNIVSRLLLCVVSTLPVAASAVALASGDDGTVEARQPNGRIQLDGRLDEPAWHDATAVELVQQAPRPGLPTPYKTEVRILVLKGVTESWRYFMAPFNVQTESGEHLEFNWAPQYEFLPEPFEIAGVVVPPGAYRFTRWRIEAQSSRHRPLQVGSTTWFGEFYSGHLTQWENYVRWNSPKGQWLVGLTAENNFGRLKEGSFVQRLWQLQSAFAWNPNLVFTSFIQYDSESQNLGTNTRLRWTIRPGNDLFIVWNRSWQRLIVSRDDLSLIPDTELIAVKLRWTFRR